MTNSVTINIFSDGNASSPSLILSGIPWYAGLTVLQAMIIGEALNPKNFSFRVEYRSIYGAQIDSIDGLADSDKPNHYWLLWVNGKESSVGASEAILFEDLTNQLAIVDWKYTDVAASSHTLLPSKTKVLS